LADLEAAFRQATRGPAVLAVDGGQVADDLPARQIPLDEMRRLLLHGRVSFETKDRVLGLVAGRAQSGDEAWVVALAGLLMPGLKRVARRLRRIEGVDAHEVGSAVVVGLLEALAHLDPHRDRIAASVCWEVYRRAHRAVAPRERSPLPLSEHVARPTVSGAHPEEVLARAVRAGVLTPDDAELIAATRLERRPVSDLALSLGLPRPRLAKRRLRAEARIAELLRREAAGTVSDAHRSWWPAGHAAVEPRSVDGGALPYRWRARPRLDVPTPAVPGLVAWSATPEPARPLAIRRTAA
jgi:DNA-directed RNA polymerase specialized sigma24 family protein